MTYEIQMPPQDAHGDEYFDEAALRLAIYQQCGIRLGEWLQFVLTAVDEFETNAYEHIAELEYEHDAKVQAVPLVSGFTSMLAAAFPAGKLALASVSAFVNVVTYRLQTSYNDDLVAGLSGAKLKLQKAVAAFTDLARKEVTAAFPSIDDNLSEHIGEWLTWVDSGSTDPGYVEAFCDWLGFVEPTRENTVQPLRQALESAFFAMYQGVRAQLVEATEGDPYDTIFPAKWEREGRDEQERLYKEHGEQAWDDAYKY